MLAEQTLANRCRAPSVTYRSGMPRSRNCPGENSERFASAGNLTVELSFGAGTRTTRELRGEKCVRRHAS